MKDVCVWLVAFLMMMFASRYAYQIWKREISPTLTTWITFLLGTGLSLTTYAIAEEHDFRSGILNSIDVVSVIVVLLAIFIWGNRKVRFSTFEKWYLGGIGTIVAYGLLSKDAWGSNIFAQTLIGLGYIPTAHRLLTLKKNVESFSAWGVNFVASVIALYPAMVEGNSLSVLYALRTMFFVLSMIAMMSYCEYRSKKV